MYGQFTLVFTSLKYDLSYEIVTNLHIIDTKLLEIIIKSTQSPESDNCRIIRRTTLIISIILPEHEFAV